MLNPLFNLFRELTIISAIAFDNSVQYFKECNAEHLLLKFANNCLLSFTCLMHTFKLKLLRSQSILGFLELSAVTKLLQLAAEVSTR